ncbi:5-hydroxytryptamine receptor 1-like [Hydractinia symbiolongicarpus]|uniref:5-hydroxytryptamine receptor 1-like n=1 Tax=Hydractinia symbiolongicarpus TaxID=13093 RepID=UPI002550B678|nr:5-hydroxytryptamine receptor 1-like [Hydractinia symbiolongicarpus]
MNAVAWFKFISLLLIDLTALCGNLIMLAVATRNTSLRKFQNAFIFNMAFADLLDAVFIMPSALINIWHGGWVYAETTCDIFAVMKVTVTLVSVYSLSGISLQRYFYIVKSTKKLNSYSSATIGIATVWILSIFLSVTPFLNWGIFGFEDGKEVCTVLFHLTPSHTLTVFMTGLVLNAMIMLFCYGMIFQTLLRSQRRTRSKKYRKCGDSLKPNELVTNNNTNYLPEKLRVEQTNDKPANTVLYELKVHNVSTESIKSNTPRELPLKYSIYKTLSSAREQRLLKTIAVVIVVFLCCWTPYVVFNLVRAYHKIEDINSVDTITMWLGFANSAANPLIYGLLNKQFKTAMKNVVRCKHSK